ncbi:MAG: preprotein translocase subunit YajC [Bacillota bacterium]
MNQSVATLLYIAVLFGLLYFLLIRPQQVRQKKHQQMIRNLKVNDPVITIGGIYGTIVKIKEDTFVIRVADNVRMEILKTAVAQVRQKEEEEKD